MSDEVPGDVQLFELRIVTSMVVHENAEAQQQWAAEQAITEGDAK